MVVGVELIEEAVRRLGKEMELPLRVGEVQDLSRFSRSNVVVAEVHYENRFYGGFVLMTDGDGVMTSCAYHGRHPNLNHSTTSGRVVFGINGNGGRTDRHKVPFLGKDPDSHSDCHNDAYALLKFAGCGY